METIRNGNISADLHTTDVCVEIYVYGYEEARYTTIELLRGFLLSFPSINVKKYHKKHDCCLNTFNNSIRSVPSNGVTYLCNYKRLV